ncbi:hypothetical protein H9Q72_003380 [Fusarium xylarioides]|uniref:LEA domain protein n=1 Tax=Fusarium xylarioides TaxID=221167 RepID=A0A9P7L8N0_9HYPO|nr:hypothetical protein H9Q72_003380 [Fusarium xylarioides]
MSSMEKDRIESDDQTMSSEEAPRRERHSKKKGSKRRQQAPPQQQQQQQGGGSGPLDQLPLAGDLGNTVGGVTDGVSNTLGGVTGGLGGLTGGQQQGGGGGDAGKDTLRLRLDLNLDIEIQLKARIHGDLELSLLTRQKVKPHVPSFMHEEAVVMSPHKPSSTSHTSTSKQPFWHGAGIRSALSSAISIFQPGTSRPSRPPKQVQDQQPPQQQQQDQEKLQPHLEDHQPQEQTDPIIPMSSSSPTPDGDPTHSTYEVNVPVRNGRTSEPKVANPEIRIPRIKPVSESTDQTDAHSDSDSKTQTQPQSPEKLAVGLDGKYVDEFGNILDWDGTVLGRVEGDLPSMVGRPVMPNGQVLDEDGEVTGHVCENYTEPALKPLAAGGLKVDDEGNIYDDQGNRIGKLDKPMPSHDGADKLSENKDKEREQAQGTNNANAPKPPGAPRPDELFLDVKSTYDGIQLTIKIPTVFNRNLVTETKSSGSQTETTDSDNR